MQIFDKFEYFPDTYVYARAFPHVHDIVVNHYLIGKFRVHERQVQIKVVELEHESVSTVSLGQGTDVLARSNEDTLFVLEHFGELFTDVKIEVSNIYQHPHMLRVVQHINQYCTVAKQEINLTGQIVAERYEFSFNNVTHVTLTDLQSPLKLANISSIFPQLTELTLNYVENVPWMGAFNIPHMTKLVLRASKFDTLSYINVRSFIAQNPQIRNLITPANSYGQYSYYNELASSLPHLEELTLTNEHMNQIQHTKKTHFEHVKSFTISLGGCSSHPGVSTIGKLPTLALDRVKSITVNAMNLTGTAPHTNDELIAFIGQFKTIERVNAATIEWSYIQLTRLVQYLPNLEVLDLFWTQSSDYSEFVRFLEDKNGLMRITVTIALDDGWTVKELEENLPTQWRVIERSTVRNDDNQQYPYITLVQSE